jgi:hypothetical protein
MDLALLFSAKDVAPFLQCGNGKNGIKIFATGLDTIQELKKRKLNFHFFHHYLEYSDLIKNYKSANKLAGFTHPYFFKSARLFFLELARSHQVMAKLIDKYQPEKIYVADDVSHQIFIKYLPQTYNLIPKVLVELCPKRKIRLEIFRTNNRKQSLLLMFLFSLLTKIKLSFSGHPLPQFSNSHPNLILAASDYHLANLDSFIKRASQKWNLIILGKSPKTSSWPSKVVHFNQKYRLGFVKTISNALKTIIFWKKDCQIQFHRLRPEIVKILNEDYANLIIKQLRYWNLVLKFEGEFLWQYFSLLFSLQKPVALLSSNSLDNHNRILHLVSKKYHIQDFVVLHYPLLCLLDAIEEQAGVESNLFVSGEKSRQLLNERFFNSRIFVTGLPAYDHYSTDKFLPPAAINQPVKILFLLSQSGLYFQDPIDIAIYQILEELDKLADKLKIEVTLRPHPGQKLNIIESKKRFYPIKIDNQIKLKSQLVKNHIVIAHTTSAVIDAMIMKKPLIYFNTFETKNYSPFAIDGAALGVYRTHQLIHSIRSLIEHPNQLVKNQQKFLKIYCSNIIGKSSKRIIRSIESLCKVKN